MKYLFIIIFSIFFNLAYANELPTEDEIYQQLVPYEKSRGLTIKKKEKASFDFDMINFEFDSSVISINSYEILKRIGNVLNRDDMQTVKFEIIGHTDAKGDANYFTTGVGLELAYNSINNRGQIGVYDRGNSVYKQVYFYTCS